MLLAGTGTFAQGSLCENPIVITSLPYSTSDDTANYLDSYDPQTTTHPACAMTTFGNYYHGGNDVIYAYTPAVSGTIKVEIPAALGWTGMFIYTNCADIGVTYAACATGPSAGARTIDNFAVTAGTTYYIFISSWPTPQTVTYTLNVTNTSLGVNDMPEARNVALYPNPVSSTISILSDFTFTKAVAYNVNGQQIALKMTGNDIDASALQSGFYVLELTTGDGTQLRKKFVKTGK